MPLSLVGGGVETTPMGSDLVVMGMGAPATATATATLTIAQLTSGTIVANPSTTAASYTLPTAASLDAMVQINNFGDRPNIAFTLYIINLGTTSGAITMVAGTGWTIVGSATIAVTSSAHFRARRTATGAWTLYRMA